MIVIKVTRIKERYHARLFYKDKVYDEMACQTRRDMGWICREMLRWFSKSSGIINDFAESARNRQIGRPVGKVWYKKDLK